jgi:small-conductance mechanosensitive channel
MNKYITELLKGWQLSPWLWNIIVLAAAILIGLILHYILRYFFIRKATTTDRFSFIRSIIFHLGKPLSYFLPLFWIAILLPVLQLDITPKHRLSRIIEIALIINSAWLLIRFVSVIQDYIYHRFDLGKKDNLRERRILTQLQFIRRLIVSFVVIMTVAAVLLSFSAMRKIGTGLLTGVGIGGIIIGFAAQRSLGNLLAGFQIAFTQPIRLDDQVVVEGEFGWIEEITLTYVVVRIWDERRLVLPINYFIEKPFQNWTRKTAQIQGVVFLYTDYGIPVEALRKELDRLLNNHPLWDKRSGGLVVTDANAQVIELRVSVSAKNSGDLFDLRCHLREQLVKFINESYPQYLPKTRAYLEHPDVEIGNNPGNEKASFQNRDSEPNVK